MNKAEARKRIPVVIVLVLIVSGLAWWLARPRPFYYAGTVEATEVTLSPGVSAKIASLEVKEGDAVKRGRVLVRLAGEDIRLSARLAEEEFRRGAQLLRDGSITQSAFDKLKTQRDQAALMVDWLTISAPRDGIVLHTYREAGEWARPGMNLLTLGDLSEVWAFVYVAQPMLARLQPGMTVKGFLPELEGRIFDGRIAMIRSEAEFTPRNVQTRDERTRLVYGVKIVFQNPDRILKPGMTIEVDLDKMAGKAEQVAP